MDEEGELRRLRIYKHELKIRVLESMLGIKARNPKYADYSPK